jgi:hypothetical protein
MRKKVDGWTHGSDMEILVGYYLLFFLVLDSKMQCFSYTPGESCFSTALLRAAAV